MKKKLTRRGFLSASAAAVAAPMIVPASALGRDGTVAPSERITVGCIGIRGRGFSDLQWLIGNKDTQVLAICDIWKQQREKVKAFVDETYGNTDCAMYRDLREFLPSRPDIDAVLIATGDHWHAQASVRAMREGKDVYTEKPSSMTIAEGQAVVEAAKRYGRVYQTGTQRLSEANHVFCIEMARTGRLGKVHTAYAHIAPWDAAKMERKWKPAQHWNVDAGQRHYDTYQSLTHDIAVGPEIFFAQLVPSVQPNESFYGEAWKMMDESTRGKHERIVAAAPFCDLTVFNTLNDRIPGDSAVHLANSTPARYA
ncbi:MAG TPA: Gfo/Idh/MocA family oxidoreductase, partial [Candidatus Hydrogenedentes bacterium]|nr:Gfo/Idh/MocA family oxidoreductase [Candidatus Hydrogenedentota bacterium]